MEYIYKRAINNKTQNTDFTKHQTAMGTASDYEMYSCEYCDSQISNMTKKLQLKPTESLLWRRHGVCSASCSSKVKINQSAAIGNNGNQDSRYGFDNVIDTALLSADSARAVSREEMDIMNFCRRRKIACHIVLVTGNLFQVVGVIGGYYFFIRIDQ